MNFSDIAGLQKPLTKLVEVVSKGIGTLYEPRAIRSKADAEAYRMRVLAEARKDIKLLGAPSVAPAVLIQQESTPEDLVARAKVRVLTQEIEGQINVEAIADHAAANLPQNVSDAPVDENWRRKFFTEAENICDQDLQVIWGKILAGETASPGRYSLRTLDVLKQLTKEEANLFGIASNLADSSGSLYLPGDHNAVEKFGLEYGALLKLREAGLIHTSDSLVRRFDGLSPGISHSTMNIAGVWIQVRGEQLRNQTLPVLAFTGPGLELRELAVTGPNEEYLRMLATYFRGRGLTVMRGSFIETAPGQGLLRFDDPLYPEEIQPQGQP